MDELLIRMKNCDAGTISGGPVLAFVDTDKSNESIKSRLFPIGLYIDKTQE